VLLVSFRGWVDAAVHVEDAVFRIVGTVGILGIILALVNTAKEKFGMAIWSILFPLAGLPSAFRLAKPNSVWAKLFTSTARRGDPRSASPATAGDVLEARGRATCPAQAPASRGGPESTSSSITTPSEAAAGIASSAPSTPASSADDHGHDRDRRVHLGAPPL